VDHKAVGEAANKRMRVSQYAERGTPADGLHCQLKSGERSGINVCFVLFLCPPSPPVGRRGDRSAGPLPRRAQAAFFFVTIIPGNCTTCADSFFPF
jgi:hypothetical protein